jgi:hypothetical protein
MVQNLGLHHREFSGVKAWKVLGDAMPLGVSAV